MALAIKVRQGGDAGAVLLDVSAGVPEFIDEVAQVTTSSAYGQGTGSQGSFVFHDELGEVQSIGTAQLLGHNQVTITEDASGSAYWLMRGRISLHDASRADGAKVQAGRQHKVTVDDINSELHGIILTAPWPRTAETGLERFIAAIEEFASGTASDYTNYRPSTVITAARGASGHLMFPHPVDGEVTMEVRTGDDAYPIGTALVDILRECAETEGQNWGVVIHDTAGSSHACMLYMEEDDFTVWQCSLSISDVISEVDNVTTFFPWWRTGAAVEQDGGDVVSYVVTEFGDERLTAFAENAATVTKYDVWGEKINDATSQTQAGADLRAGHLLAGKSREDVTHQPTLILPADKVHLVRAGMSITIKARASRDQEAIGATATRIIAQVKLTPYSPEETNGERFYIADLKLARPKKIARERRPPRKPPRAPRQPVAGNSHRLYLSAHQAGEAASTPQQDDAPNLSAGDLDAAWDAFGTFDYLMAYKDPASTVTFSNDNWTVTNTAAGLYAISGGLVELDGPDDPDGSLLAIVQSGGSMRVQVAANSRHGVGINEGLQDHLLAGGVRVYRPGSGFVGTALAVGTIGNLKFAAQGTRVNRSGIASLAAVSGAVAGDYLAFEFGVTHGGPTSGGAGAGLGWTDTGASDLPEDQLETSALNSWIQLTGTGTAGDSTGATTLPGESSTGTQTGVYSPVDHDHEHGMLADDGVHLHDADQIADLDTATSNLGWFNVKNYGATGDGATDDTDSIDDAIADLNAAGGGVLYFPHGEYSIDSALTTISVPCVVMGDGAGGFPYASGDGSAILQSSDTANGLTFSDDGWVVKDLAIINTEGAPTAGAGISSGFAIFAKMTGVTVSGFYDCIDISDGAGWSLTDSFIHNPVRYGFRIRGTVSPDSGDQSISGCYFMSDTHDADAAIRYESAGGLKIVNVKINHRGVSGGQFVQGIDTAISGSIQTVILMVSNSSIENITGDGIHVTCATGSSFFRYMNFVGNQFGLYNNNSGKAISLVSTDAGDLSDIVIASNVFHTGGTARSAVQITNCDNVTFAGNLLSDNFTSLYTNTSSTNVIEVGSGASDLDDLTDVTITSATLDDDLRYNGSAWVNDSRKWEALTNGEDVFVWEGDALVHDWST